MISCDELTKEEILAILNAIFSNSLTVEEKCRAIEILNNGNFWLNKETQHPTNSVIDHVIHFLSDSSTALPKPKFLTREEIGEINISSGDSNNIGSCVSILMALSNNPSVEYDSLSWMYKGSRSDFLTSLGVATSRLSISLRHSIAKHFNHFATDSREIYPILSNIHQAHASLRSASLFFYAGMLLNPYPVNYGLYGASSENNARILAYHLAQRPNFRFWVVSGPKGLNMFSGSGDNIVFYKGKYKLVGTSEMYGVHRTVIKGSSLIKEPVPETVNDEGKHLADNALRFIRFMTDETSDDEIRCQLEINYRAAKAVKLGSLPNVNDKWTCSLTNILAFRQVAMFPDIYTVYGDDPLPEVDPSELLVTTKQTEYTYKGITEDYKEVLKKLDILQ